MNIQKSLKFLNKEMNLKYNNKLFNSLVAKREQIIIDNYLTGCPAPEYRKHKNQTKESTEKNFSGFIESKEFKAEMKKPQGAKTNKKDIKWKIQIIKKSKINNKLKKKLFSFYKKVAKLDRGFGVSIVDSQTFKDKEVILHEFIHILLSSNNIRTKSWKMNEGLTTYLTSFAMKKEQNHRNKPNKKLLLTNSTLYFYLFHANKWYHYLNKVKEPNMRHKIIIEKSNEFTKKDFKNNLNKI